MTAAPSVTEARRDFLAEVAWLHHEHRLTQDEIARRFAVSRSTVSRALADAERLGIVRVVVTVPLPGEARLSAALTSTLGVRATVGVAAATEGPALAAARAAARLLERVADAGPATVCVSWGRTLAMTGGMVRPRPAPGLRVVDAVGHPGSGGMVPAVEVTRVLAAALGATVAHLPAPAFVPAGASAAALLASRAVRDALAVARAADVTLVSVGRAEPDSLLVAEGLVPRAMVEACIEAGAVGEILGHWYDAAGRELPDRDPVPVGLTLADLRASRRVIGVAGGAEKATAVLAALRGGFLHEVVVDDSLAEALLAADRSSGRPAGAPAVIPQPGPPGPPEDPR